MQNTAKIVFYADANNSGQYDAGELKIESEQFRVVPIKVYNLTYDVSSLLTSNIGQPFYNLTVGERTARVQRAIDDSVALARIKDAAADYRAAFQIQVSPWMGGNPPGVFTPGTLINPDPLLSVQIHQHSMPGNHIRFVDQITDAQGVTFGNEIIIGWQQKVDNTIVHEFGHYVGISHYYFRPELIMNNNVEENQHQLTKLDAEKYTD